MTKMESIDIKSKQTLRMVKNTVSLVCYSTKDRDSKKEVVINEQEL
jgi:hypothetical protein